MTKRISLYHPGSAIETKQQAELEAQFNVLWRLLKPRDNSGNRRDLLLQRTCHFFCLITYLRPDAFSLDGGPEFPPQRVFASRGKKLVQLLQRGLREFAGINESLRQAFDLIDFTSLEVWGDQLVLSKRLMEFHQKLNDQMKRLSASSETNGTSPDSLKCFFRYLCLDYMHSKVQALKGCTSVEDIAWPMGNWIEEVVASQATKESPAEPFTVNNPCCGCGTLFPVSANEPEAYELYGQDPDSLAIAVSRLYLLMCARDSRLVQHTQLAVGNAIQCPAFVDKTNDCLTTFDLVVCEPPPKVGNLRHDSLENDSYGRFPSGVPSLLAGEYFFIAHALKSLKDNGRAAIVVPSTALTRGEAGSVEYSMRKSWIDENVLDMVVDLTPGDTDADTGMRKAILFFRRDKHPHDPIGMIGKGAGSIGDDAEWYESHSYKTFLRNKRVGDASGLVDAGNIRKNDFRLTPRTYLSKPRNADEAPTIEVLYHEVQTLTRSTDRHLKAIENSRQKQESLMKSLRYNVEASSKVQNR